METEVLKLTNTCISMPKFMFKKIMEWHIYMLLNLLQGITKLKLVLQNCAVLGFYMHSKTETC